VVINLVINALDAMEHHGTLTLRTCRDSAGKLILLDVTDTGCGISVEHRAHIFDPFFTTKEPGKGTGLGLSTSFGIVQDSGGELALLKSSPEGTTFRVSLPAKQEPVERPSQTIG
jgi:signal transduction histidine kinase